MKKLYFILLITYTAVAQQVTTITGFAGGGYLDGSLATAQFSGPRGICTDPTGTIIYVADSFNNLIRKIDLNTNMVSTIAGSTEGYADGVGTAAQFFRPTGVCLDSNGFLYVTDYFNNRIRKIDLTTNTVTTFAGSTQGYANGLGTNAKFSYPVGICIDSNNNLYVSEDQGNKIRKITPTRQVTNFAGSGVAGFADGAGAAAQFYAPVAICIDTLNNLYVSDWANTKIRKISPIGEVTTIAGSDGGYLDGPALQAKFVSMGGVCIDNNRLYLVDNHRVRSLDLTTSIISTFAGSIAGATGNTDGDVATALLRDPIGICLNNSTIYFTELALSKIRKITNILFTESFHQNTFNLYPNPSKGKFKLQSNYEFNSIVIFNMQGNIVFKKELLSYSYEIETILKTGLYIIEITTTNNKQITKKMIVE